MEAISKYPRKQIVKQLDNQSIMSCIGGPARDKILRISDCFKGRDRDRDSRFEIA